MDQGSFVGSKSYDFALLIISLYKKLSGEKKEFILSKQMLRSGTSIGANANEAISAQSKRDFVHKLSISLKEAHETKYWLNLLTDSDYLNPEQSAYALAMCDEIIKMLSSIIITTKSRYLTKK